jgi:hypothetical protein
MVGLLFFGLNGQAWCNPFDEHLGYQFAQFGTTRLGELAPCRTNPRGLKQVHLDAWGFVAGACDRHWYLLR